MMDLSIGEIAEACGGKLILQGKTTKTDIDVSNTLVSSVVIDSRLAEPQGGIHRHCGGAGGRT